MKDSRPPKKTTGRRPAGTSGRSAAIGAASSAAQPLFDESYRVLFDTMSQGVIFRDVEGRTLSANPAAERVLGRRIADLLGKTSAEVHPGAVREDGSLIPPDAFPADVALRTGKPVIDFVMGIVNPGELGHRWISVNAMPIFRPGESRPFLAYILFDDITERRVIARELQVAHDHLEHEVQERIRELAGTNEELSAQIAVRKKAEAALRESEAKFRRLAENAEDLIYLYRLSPERGFEYVSPSSTKLTGYTPEEHYANPDLRSQIVHPDDRSKLADLTAGRTDPAQPLLLRWIRKDGRTVWIEQRNIPITDASGAVVAFQGAARDVTERAWAEERLRENERFLQTIIETEPECVKMLGADGSLLMMNRAGLDMIQADSLTRVRGKAVAPLVAPEHRRPFSALLADVFRGGRGTLAFEMIGLQGRRLWMDTHMVPLRDEKGRIIAALCITRDITERKRMEEQLRESEANLREAQRLSNIGSWVRDLRTQEIQWSDETFRIFGLEPGRNPMPFNEFLNSVHPQDRDAVTRALDDVLQRKRPYDIEFRILRPDGSSRIIHAMGEVRCDGTGAAVKLLGTLQDVTERRRTEELLPRIAERINTKTGSDYFRSIAEFISQELGTDYAFVGELSGHGDAVQTVAVYAKGAFAENFTYALADTPCAGVAGKIPCFYADAIQSIFPRDTLLVDMGVRSYAGTPLFAFDGKPLGILVTLGCKAMPDAERERVVTLLQIISGRAAAELERRQSERALHTSEQRYKQLLESVTSYLYTVQIADGRAASTVHGPGCAAVTGYTPEEFSADPSLWYRMIPDEDRHLALRQSDDLLAGGRPEPIEHRVRHKNGRLVWVRSTMVPHNDEQGRITAYDGLITDITLQRRAELFAENILATVDEGFLVIDRSYTIVSVNRAYQERTGRQAADIIGKKCWEVTHRIASPCYEQGEECAVRRVFESGAPHTAMHTHHDAEGKPLFVETKAFPQRDESGQIVGAIEIINDVTDRKRLEDQLRHSQKMEAVGLLAGGISHDFNNILTAIIGYGNLLKMKVPADGPLQTYIEQILASAARAANLTQSLLAFSRKQIINPRPLDLNESILRFKKLLHRIIGEDVDIRTDLAPTALTVLADSSQIEQVLMNLATNARDAMPQGGTLTVRTETAVIGEDFRHEHGFGIPGTYACASIQDTGAGMDPKVLERIFEPFFTTKQPGEGTGLGLSIVYGIMKQNNGYITVSSTPGEGTSFRLYLPLIAAVAERPLAPAAPFPAEGHEIILIAEDDVTIRQLTRTMLGEFGYSVIEAVDGEDAIAKFREHRDDIQLVILDVVMPKKSGREVHDEIVAQKQSVKTIYISGYNADIVRKKGITDDTANFLLKPLSPMDLLRTVRRVLDEGSGATTAPAP